jgi:hypothetical protein
VFRRTIALTLIALAGALALQVAPAAATPTCVTGAACVLTLRGRESLTITTRAGIVSQACNFAMSVDVNDGVNSMSSRSLSVGSCVSTANCVPGTFQPNTSTWTLTLSNSSAPYRLTATFPQDIYVQCGMAGRIILFGPTSCVDGVAGSIATIRPGATVTVTLICQVPFVAAGMITMVTGASGTATLTISLSGTTDVTGDGISIS